MIPPVLFALLLAGAANPALAAQAATAHAAAFPRSHDAPRANGVVGTPIATLPAAGATPDPRAKPRAGDARKKAARSPESRKGAVAAVAAANRMATERPNPQLFVNAVQVYPWREGAIYQAFAAPGAVTDIALQPGETLIAVAAGDTARWAIGDTTSGAGETRRTHILVKPYAAGLSTNLIVMTDRRTYYLKLDAAAATAMTALSWTYPADALIALKASPATAGPSIPSGAGPDPERLNFSYAISGAKAPWRPLRVFDDGRRTYLEFTESILTGEAPPLFVLGDAGAAELVNYRMRGRFYIVDRLFDAAELRLGARKQQVVRIERTGAGTGGGR
jgi:type IV secretion system protein VirB9